MIVAISGITLHGRGSILIVGSDNVVVVYMLEG